MEIQVQFEKTDNRKEKRYGKTVIASAFFPELSSKPGGYWAFKEVVKSTPLKVEGVHVYVDHRSYNWRNEEYVLRFSKWLPADRPKEILSDEEARTLFPSDEILSEYAKKVYALSKERVEKEEQEEEDRKLVTHMLRWTDSEAKERAKKVCRFTQRLDALVAEFKAETIVQGTEVIKEALKEAPETLKDDGYNDTVKEMYERYVEEYLKDHKSSGLPGRFPSSSDCADVSRWLVEKLDNDPGFSK